MMHIPSHVWIIFTLGIKKKNTCIPSSSANSFYILTEAITFHFLVTDSEMAHQLHVVIPHKKVY